MPLAFETDEDCIACDDGEVYVYEKEEPTIIKRRYECETCGAAWGERESK